MKLNWKRIESELGIRALHFDSIDSTSLYLKRLIQEGKNPADLVLADEQTNGQGRVGKSFYSPRKSGLYLTFCISKDCLACEDLTPRVALAVSQSINQVFSITTGIKWVNDIYLNDRKISGVLCQSVGNFYLIGIGINVVRPEYIPPELEGRLGFCVESSNEKQCEELVMLLYRSILKWANTEKKTVLSQYREKCIHLSKRIAITKNNTEVVGECIGISDHFGILLSCNGFVSHFSSGVMSILE